MSLRVIARIEAKPDKSAEVSELLLSLIEPTRKEAGCITYELHQNREDPCDFTFVEEWASDSAFAAHAAADHLRAIGPRLEPVVVKPPDIRTYVLLA
jgi:quinol monooxygenase YgiN